MTISIAKLVIHSDESADLEIGGNVMGSPSTL